MYLSKNHLAKVDLTPLAKCRRLQYVVLSDNYLNSVSFASLTRATDLRYLLLNGNRIPRIDISPIFEAMNLEHLVFDKTTEVVADSKLRHLDYFPRPIEDMLDQILWI